MGRSSTLRVEQQAAPGRDIRREAEAEERQRRFGDDGSGDVDGGGDDDGAKRIGQDVAHNLAEFGGAERACGLDELFFPQRQELRANEARDGHPTQSANDHDDQDECAAFRPERGLQRVAEKVDDQEQQRQSRQRKKEIGQPHQCRTDPASRHTGDGADDRADEDRDEHGGEADGERDAAAVEHPREQILAEVVGAEGMLPRRPLQRRGEIDLVDRNAPDQRPDQDCQDHHAENAAAGDGKPVAPEAPPCLATRRVRRTGGHRHGGGRRCGCTGLSGT